MAQPASTDKSKQNDDSKTQSKYGSNQGLESNEEKYAPSNKDESFENPKSSKAGKRLSLEGQLKAARISLEQYVNPSKLNKDKLIPKKILKNAKGIAFLTCIKAGFLFAGNIGTGCVIIRNQGSSGNTLNRWSPPSSIGVAGLSFGFLAGGAKIDYLFILNDNFAVKQFTGSGQLRLGGELQLALGPIGRDADVSLGVGDGGVSAIYSYSHSEGLYGGLELKGKVITVRPKCNEKFYNVKSVKCADILRGAVRMPKNTDYERIIHLLNTYCLDHVFPQQIEEQIDLDAMMDLNDVNIENAVNTLHSMFVDIDREVIRIVLMEQCWGDMNHATDILLTMSNKDWSKNKAEQKIEEYDTDLIKKDGEKKEIEEVANKVKDAVIKQGVIQKEEEFDCYEVLNGRCISKAVESYQIELKMSKSNKTTKEEIETVLDEKYRINVKIGENRVCEILVYKTNPPLKYELLNVEFGLEQHVEEEKEITLEPFSSNKLKNLARSNTKKHLKLSDDDIDYENENCPIVSNINANTMSPVALLDGLVKSFEKH